MNITFLCAIIRIMNGRVGKDGVGRYTFVGYKGCSVVEYALATEEFFSLVSKNQTCSNT